MSFAEGALMEPLAVAVFACKRAQIVMGKQQKVMVTGAGPIGLLAAMAAKALGAEDVCILGVFRFISLKIKFFLTLRHKRKSTTICTKVGYF